MLKKLYERLEKKFKKERKEGVDLKHNRDCSKETIELAMTLQNSFIIG